MYSVRTNGFCVFGWGARKLGRAGGAQGLAPLFPSFFLWRLLFFYRGVQRSTSRQRARSVGLLIIQSTRGERRRPPHGYDADHLAEMTGPRAASGSTCGPGGRASAAASCCGEGLIAASGGGGWVAAGNCASPTGKVARRQSKSGLVDEVD